MTRPNPSAAVPSTTRGPDTEAGVTQKTVISVGRRAAPARAGCCQKAGPASSKPLAVTPPRKERRVKSPAVSVRDI